MARRASWALVVGLAGALFGVSGLDAQTEGRVFLPTPETVSIHEFNSFPGLNLGDTIPDGTVIQDLSGNGLHATVENNTANNNLVVAEGDVNFDVPAGANLECTRADVQEGPASVVVGDETAYAMEPTDDFSIELYMNRETLNNSANWGIVAGTFHSRNLIEDTGVPDVNGAWYGYGLIRYQEAPFPTGGWEWILSPVIDGEPWIGFAGAEHKLAPPFEIPEGNHYVVLSVDRALQSAVGYVDGVEVTRLDGMGADWAFVTPEGRDPARFRLFSGENDASTGAWMIGPRGTGFDAVRVQRKALDLDEVGEIWVNIQNGVPSPPPSGAIQASVIASTNNATVDQCVLLDGEGSIPSTGQTITQYEWKVGAGSFEVGPAKKELSFAAPDAAGVTITLRVTDSGGNGASATTKIFVTAQQCVASIAGSLAGDPLGGTFWVVPKDAVISLDGTASSSVVPTGAVQCPISGGTALPPSAIVEYSWDLNGDGTADSTSSSFDTPPLGAVGEFTIRLKVKNAAGSESTASVNVTVANSGGNSAVFHDTPDTIFHLEFNELEVGPVATETQVPDQAGTGLAMTFVDPVGDPASLEGRAGALQFSDNRAAVYVAGGNGPRGEVRDDGGLFEMAIDDSFTFEIYVKPGQADQPEWGDLAGTFKARTDGTEESARYGWGIIKSATNSPVLKLQGYAWIVCSGLGQPAEKQVPFQIQKGAYNYVAGVIDRASQTSSVYVNGKLAGSLALDPSWSFETPDGLDPAPFYLFTREQVIGQFSNCVPETWVDALRLQMVALSPQQISDNWDNITAGLGADPSGPARPTFHRGDPNDDGTVNITDGIYILNFLFLGGPGPTCAESADPNNDGTVNITDGIFVLNFLFLGGPAPASPGPVGEPCGTDPDLPGTPGDLGCASYTRC